MEELYSVILTLTLFLALILSLTAEKHIRNRIFGIAATAAALVGIIFYGGGFAYTLGFGPIAIMRSLLAVCRMFGGVNDLASIQSFPWLQRSTAQTIFWVGHFLAFYATASATVATLGGRLLGRIRTALLKRGELLVILGITPESMDYARSCMSQKRYALLFVDDGCNDVEESAVRSLGGVIEMSTFALQPDSHFLRRIGLKPGTRHLHAVAFHSDGQVNLTWARQLQSALAEAGIYSDQTSLLLSNVEEPQAEALAKSGCFGSVYAFDPYTLAARQMIRALPPCQVISFDENACATEDFSAVIVGFGKMGRAVLEQLIMNGQFTGSIFRADIFDEHPQIGSLTDSELLCHNITFHTSNGKSEELYHFLKTNEVKYIVICTGSEVMNRELAQELTIWFCGLDRIPAIIQIGKNGFLCSKQGETDLTWQKLYSSEILDLEKADKLAMIINQQYCAGNGKSAVENWKACDYFGRISSRASADFAPAFLKMIGQDSWQNLTFTESQLVNLAKTEHLRWCAFHEVMGWHPMRQDIWERRAMAFSHGDHSIRIGKDSDRRLHACMIPWEELDALSEKENAVTGGHVDYKSMDLNNVLALKELLKNAEDKSWKSNFVMTRS